jgi:hypothetical protein
VPDAGLASWPVRGGQCAGARPMTRPRSHREGLQQVKGRYRENRLGYRSLTPIRYPSGLQAGGRGEAS